MTNHPHRSRRIYTGSTFSAWGRNWTVVGRDRDGYVIEPRGCPGQREYRSRQTMLDIFHPPIASEPLFRGENWGVFAGANGYYTAQMAADGVSHYQPHSGGGWDAETLAACNARAREYEAEAAHGSRKWRTE